ncbi:MAG: 2-hydroxychromene-2-carboxylate isomerase [Myxococcaceae bacterium]|nr:2-hydroxychromene-2-carboxylate isomerase [Myxococcaceae bacterium]MCI0671810.1 2-hydroxychromene-2-carboxylate isomerase [Myxococcaceae bacterium]
MPAVLEFFFDFTSPYSYLASTQVEALAQRNGARIVWRPFLLGAVFKATGNSPPLSVPAKGAYMVKDLQDWVRQYGLPELALPSTFPVPSVKANRLALVALAEGKGPAFIHATFRAIFQAGRDVGELDMLGELAASVGLDAKVALARIEQQDVKDELRRNTDDAVARGAFGAPTFFVGDDMYCGNDRLFLVEKSLMNQKGA